METGLKQAGVDVFDQAKRTLVVADLPGFCEEDVQLELVDDLLSIFATQGNITYYRIVKLHRRAEKIIGKVFSGGILEVILG
jgi:HSP20 family molecular chaperone IbpA